MKKQIFEYILRVIIFILLSGFFLDPIGIFLAHSTEHIISLLYEQVPLLNGHDNAEILLSFIIGFSCVFMVVIGITYVFAKICGLFKKLDSLKKSQAFLIVILICITCLQITEILRKYKLFNFDFVSSIGFAGFFLIPSYLFYLFLNHLTKKYPKPFEKIGYYCSIEFWKKLIFKV